MELIELHDGLFKDENYELLKTDDFWKLPQNILKHFEKLDKSIHDIVYINDEIMHIGEKENPGIHMMTGRNNDAYFQKHFIDFIREHGDTEFYLVRDNGFLLAEVEDLFFVVAPFIQESEI
jgi:hypothetical protein